MCRSLLPPLLLLLVIGCTKVSSSLDSPSREVNALPSTGNFVTILQVSDYAEKFFHTTKATDNIEYTIEPLRHAEGDTIAYIMNTNGHGWKILSADSRTPAILAEDYRGSFSLTDGNPGVRIWIDCMRADMAAVRRSNDDQLKFSEEEIAANRAFWNQQPTRKPYPHENEGGGYWAVRTTSEVLVADSLNHMTPQWDQCHPYNAYCPFKLSNPTERVPAGCVAVAGAEVLYYLHKKIGLPSHMFSYCECPGNINNPQLVFDLPSQYVWGMMDSLYNNLYADKESILIAYVGSWVQMDYGDNGSGADSALLQTSAFPVNGISCERSNYEQDTVKNSLDNLLPVIVSAYTQLLFGSGHCFVIDGYKKTYTKYTHFHYWEPDNPGSWYNPSLYEPYYTYSYTTPEITAIKINWGWWDQWYPYNLNDGWYTLTGDWCTEDIHGNDTSYNYYRKMIYGFRPNS